MHIHPQLHSKTSRRNLSKCLFKRHYSNEFYVDNLIFTSNSETEINTMENKLSLTWELEVLAYNIFALKAILIYSDKVNTDDKLKVLGYVYNPKNISFL